MATSNSRLSYTHEYETLDRALLSPKGLRCTFPSEGSARSFQQRLNTARRKNREDNAATYPDGHPLHGASEYDTLQIRLRTNGSGSAVLIEKMDREMQIEEIEE